MTDSPVSLAAHVRRDLSIDQKHALKTAVTRLHTEFGEHFGVETIERFSALLLRPVRRSGHHPQLPPAAGRTLGAPTP